MKTTRRSTSRRAWSDEEKERLIKFYPLLSKQNL